MDHRRERNGDELYENRDGQLRMSFPEAGIIVSRFTGDLSADFAVPMCDAMKRVTTSGARLMVFADFEAAHNYHTAARLKLTQATVSLRAQTEGMHFLTRSRILALGIQAANLAVGNLVLHDDRAAFERALQLAIVNARRARTAASLR